MSLRFAAPDTPALPLHLVAEEALEGWLAGQTPEVAAWVRAMGFTGALGRVLIVPDTAALP